MHRRQVLLGTGVALSTVIAGCTGDERPDDGGNASETDETGRDATDGDDESKDEIGEEAEPTDDGNDDDAADDEDGETAAIETDEGPDDPFDVDGQSPVQGLRITGDELVEDDASVSVVGTVVNTSGEDLASIDVAARFYDADGERVDENVTSAGGMDDGDELPIEITSFEADVVDYEVAIVNADPHEQIFE